jgi:uncharacterized protein (DUF885 family)
MGLSPIFEFADRYVTEHAALNPCLATEEGIAGYDHLLTDYSPAGHEARTDHDRAALAELADLRATNDDDRLANDFITERLKSALLAADSGEWLRALRAIEAPANTLRGVFDLMPRAGEEAWTNIATRLQALPRVLDGLRATYDHGRATGTVAARRQVLVAADQCATWAANRWFASLADEAAARGDVPDALQRRLREYADATDEAYGAFANYLLDDYAPDADAADACGAERYRIGVRAMLGADLDPQDVRVGVERLPSPTRRDGRNLRARQAGRELRRGDRPPGDRPRSRRARRRRLSGLASEPHRRGAEPQQTTLRDPRCDGPM